MPTQTWDDFLKQVAAAQNTAGGYTPINARSDNSGGEYRDDVAQSDPSSRGYSYINPFAGSNPDWYAANPNAQVYLQDNPNDSSTQFQYYHGPGDSVARGLIHKGSTAEALGNVAAIVGMGAGAMGAFPGFPGLSAAGADALTPEMLAQAGFDASAYGGAYGAEGALASAGAAGLDTLTPEMLANAGFDASSYGGVYGGAEGALAGGGAGSLDSLATLSPEKLQALQGVSSSSYIPPDFSTVLNAGETGAGVGAGGVGVGGGSGTSVTGGIGGSFSDAGFAAAHPELALDSAYVGAGTAGTSLSSLVDSLGGARGITTLAGALAGGVSSAASPNSTTATQSSKLDPRMDSILYGADGRSGLLNDIVTAGATPQAAGAKAFGTAADNYVGANGATDLAAMRTAANGLMNSNISAPNMNAASMNAASVANTPGMNAANVANTPGMSAASVANTPGMNAASANAASINAPSQNSLDLSSSYNNMINGNAGANPYLTNALQSAVDQTNASYQKNQTDLTNNLTRNILPGIRGGALAAGQYGGSRQGIAEGNAISDYTNQLSNSNLQLGLANSANTTGQQANAYNQGQDRSLSAMNSLGGQQYGVATQNASNQQQSNLANAGYQNNANQANFQGQLQSNLANAGYQNNANQTNYQGSLNSNLANAGYQNTANQTNYQGLLNTNLANAGYQQAANTTNSGYTQAANQNNLSSQLSTNTLNSNNQQAGISASNGLLSNANTYANANNNYDLNRLGTVSGLLSPYTGLNSTQSTTTPQNSNTLGSIIGGAATGLSLYNAFK